MEKTAIFQLEAESNDPGSELMNLHLSITSYNASGEQIATNYTDTTPIRCGVVYRVDTAIPVHSVSLSLYAVPVGSPAFDRVADGIAVKLSFRIKRDGKELDAQTLSVNRWGGTQRIDLRYK